MEAAFIRHSCTRHRILQTRNGTAVADAMLGIVQVLAVVLNQCLKLVTASIQRTSKIQGNIG